MKEKDTYRRVGHPAARLHLVGIETPEFQLFFEQWSAHIGRVMKLARSVQKPNRYVMRMRTT